MSILRVQDVGLSRNGHKVVNAASLTLPKGRVVGLVGPNGAGKTTLLRIMAGLQKPECGHVWLCGQDMAQLSPLQRARQLAFLPQEAEKPSLMPLRAVVALGRLPYGQTHAQAANHPAVTHAIEATGLQALQQRPARYLSGGERARMALARALATDTPCILADEPVAALDPAHALGVMHLFANLAHQHGKTILVVLHDLSLATRFCDELVVMRDGAIVTQGPAGTVLDDTVMRTVYQVYAKRVEAAVIPWSLC